MNETTTTKEPERTARQSWPYAASALVYLVAPFAIGTLAPTSTATVLVLVWLPLAAFALGLLDGRLFRRTWAFPVITGAFCWLAMLLYSNPGTWIYAVGVMLVCRLGGMLGGIRTGRG